MGSFRLRPGKDDDIIQSMSKLPSWQEKSDIVRAALRLYFGLDKVEPIKCANYSPICPEEPPTEELTEKLDNLFKGI